MNVRFRFGTLRVRIRGCISCVRGIVGDWGYGGDVFSDRQEVGQNAPERRRGHTRFAERADSAAYEFRVARGLECYSGNIEYGGADVELAAPTEIIRASLAGELLLRAHTSKLGVQLLQQIIHYTATGKQLLTSM